jgi:hypothetical protein
VFFYSIIEVPVIKQAGLVQSGEFCGDKEAQKINRSQPLQPDVAKQQGGGDESVTWMQLGDGINV